MGPVEVSPWCLVWASNACFPRRGKGGKKRRTDLCHQSRLFHGVSNTQPRMTPAAKWKTSRRGFTGSHTSQEAAEQPAKNVLSPDTQSNQASSCSDRRLTDRPLYEDHGTSVAKFDSPPQLSPLGAVSYWGRSLQKPRPWSQCGDNPSRSAAVCETLRPAARPLATATTKVTQIADIFYPIIIKMNMKTGWS